MKMITVKYNRMDYGHRLLYGFNDVHDYQMVNIDRIMIEYIYVSCFMNSLILMNSKK